MTLPPLSGLSLGELNNIAAQTLASSGAVSLRKLVPSPAHVDKPSRLLPLPFNIFLSLPLMADRWENSGNSG